MKTTTCVPNDGAFAAYCEGEVGYGTDGLTKREYFAGLAQQALVSALGMSLTPVSASKTAVEYADALIVALNAKEPVPATAEAPPPPERPVDTTVFALETLITAIKDPHIISRLRSPNSAQDYAAEVALSTAIQYAEQVLTGEVKS